MATTVSQRRQASPGRQDVPAVHAALRGDRVPQLPQPLHVAAQRAERDAQALGEVVAGFGGEATAVTYQDAGNVQEPSEADQVMWGQVAADSGFRVMAYDVPSRLPYAPGREPVLRLTARRHRRGGHPVLGAAVPKRDRGAAARARSVGTPVRHAEGPLRRHLGHRRRHEYDGS